MEAWRIQPVTTLSLTILLSALGLWPLLGVYGVIMLAGAVSPRLNLLDRWVALLSGTEHRTVLYPKRFAAGMGGVMLIAAGILGVSGAAGAAWVFSVMTIGAAALHAGFKFCLGCWLFNQFVAPRVERRARTAA